MKLPKASLSLLALLSLSGCYSLPAYYGPPVPREDIGERRDDRAWVPYSPTVPQSRPGDGWQPRGEGAVARAVPAPETPVRRDTLPEIKARPPASASAPVDQAASRGEEFVRAQPKDPPVDPSRRRAYSSRPDRNAALNADDSAFGPRAQPASPVREAASRRGISSEWADKAVRADNRAGFDRMVSDSARLGRGSFEDEAGRIYFGERRGLEDGCTVVEVTVTTNGGLPVVSRGLAYDCR